MDDITEDTVLDGRVRLLQPAQGYRAAIDPVFLAAAVPATGGQRVLDAGSGVGTAALCLAARVPDCRIVELETQAPLHELACRNVVLNGRTGLVEPILGRLDAPPAGLAPGSFDHVMTNPPYVAGGTVPPHAGKALANQEADVDLAAWMRCCLGLLKPKGWLTVVYRADRLDDLLAALGGRVGGTTVIPLWPKLGRPAKRVVLRARKGVASPFLLHSGLIIHREDGHYTEAAEAVLRHGGVLPPASGGPVDSGLS
jgi:tRNA1(Val) A37 N6-methylase TrmN6